MATIWSRQRTPPSENEGLYLPVPRMEIDGVPTRRSCLAGEATFHVAPGRRLSLSEGIHGREQRISKPEVAASSPCPAETSATSAPGSAARVGQTLRLRRRCLRH